MVIESELVNRIKLSLIGLQVRFEMVSLSKLRVWVPTDPKLAFQVGAILSLLAVDIKEDGEDAFLVELDLEEVAQRFGGSAPLAKV